jgi:hypothetical protein
MSVKPTRVQAKQVAAYINGVPTRRIQTFDWNSNYTVDSVFEIGNAGLVEDVVTLVETNVTVNSNEWGTTDLEAMMFGTYITRNVVGTKGNTPATIYLGISGVNGGKDTIATNDWVQVIRIQSFATTNDTEYCKVQGSSTVSTKLKCGKTANVHRLRFVTANKLTAAPATADIVSLVNHYTITQTTVDSDPIHIVLPHRYNTSGTAIMYSVLLPRCYVDNLTYNFDVGGECSQNYTLVGEEERLLLGAWRETNSIVGSFISYDSTVGSLTFRVPINSNACFGSPYAVYAGSNLVKWSGTPGGTINQSNHTSHGYTIKAYIGKSLGIDSTTQLIYYFYNGAGHKTGFRGLTNIDSGMGKLSKGYIRVEFQHSTDTASKLQRCTNVSINVPLTRESIDELGESRSIAKPLEGNLRNEITLAFNRNDLREFAQLLGSDTTFDAGTLNEILMSDLKAVKDMTIILKFYNSQTSHVSTTLLKTMTFTGCNFIGDNSTTPITGAGGLELNFSTQALNIEGSGLPPVYA